MIKVFISYLFTFSCRIGLSHSPYEISVLYEDWKYFFPDRFVRDFTAAITWPCAKLFRRLGYKLLVVTSEAQQEKFPYRNSWWNLLLVTKRCRQVAVRCKAVAIYQTIVLESLCIVALQVELCGISGYDSFVRTGQISHREVFLSSVPNILQKTVLRGAFTLMDLSGQSVLMLFRLYGRRDQRSYPLHNRVERYVWTHEMFCSLHWLQTYARDENCSSTVVFAISEQLTLRMLHKRLQCTVR